MYKFWVPLLLFAIYQSKEPASASQKAASDYEEYISISLQVMEKVATRWLIH